MIRALYIGESIVVLAVALKSRENPGWVATQLG